MSDSQPETILIADDEPANLRLLSRSMRSLGYDVLTAGDGEEALELVTREAPDLVLLDVRMPRLDGFGVCRRLKAAPSTRLIPVILLTGLSASADRIAGIEAGADDFVSKPFVAAELVARVRSLLQRKHYTDGLDSAEAVVMNLALTIEARDPYTRGHCERLADYASALGRRLGLSDAQCRALYRGGFLHDVGKIGIPDAILMKVGALTAEEHAVMQRHTTIGDALCGELNALREVRLIVRHHHERQDGTGYPDRLAGDDVPLLAQIMSIVDVYDALTTDRPYRSALSSAEAIRELRVETARGWHRADLVTSFIEMLAARSPRQPAEMVPRIPPSSAGSVMTGLIATPSGR